MAPKPPKRRSALVYSVRERGKEVFSCEVRCNRCLGTTADGRRCARKACVGTPFCWTHAQRLLGVRAKDFPGMGKGLVAVAKAAAPRRAAGGGAAARPIVFRKGEFIMPYVGETISKEEYERRYVRGSEDSAAEYVIVDGAGRYVDGACLRRLPALANTAVTKKERAAPEYAPFDGRPIRYLSSVITGTNSKFTVRTAAHEWHGTTVPAHSAWIVATRPIREGDQILTYYGSDYRVYTTPGYQQGSTTRKRVPVRTAAPPKEAAAGRPASPASRRASASTGPRRTPSLAKGSGSPSSGSRPKKSRGAGGGASEGPPARGPKEAG
jgi:hypothetical protein